MVVMVNVAIRMGQCGGRHFIVRYLVNGKFKGFKTLDRAKRLPVTQIHVDICNTQLVLSCYADLSQSRILKQPTILITFLQDL